MPQITDFGKDIKKKLVDVNQTQIWLIGEVAQKTGLFFDSRYLYKIMSGKAAPPKIVEAICEILELEHPAQQQERSTENVP